MGLASDVSVLQHGPLRAHLSKTVLLGVPRAALGGSQIPPLAADLAEAEAGVIAEE